MPISARNSPYIQMLTAQLAIINGRKRQLEQEQSAEKTATVRETQRLEIIQLEVLAKKLAAKLAEEVKILQPLLNQAVKNGTEGSLQDVLKYYNQRVALLSDTVENVEERQALELVKTAVSLTNLDANKSTWIRNIANNESLTSIDGMTSHDEKVILEAVCLDLGAEFEKAKDVLNNLATTIKAVQSLIQEKPQAAVVSANKAPEQPKADNESLSKLLEQFATLCSQLPAKYRPGSLSEKLAGVVPEKGATEQKNASQSPITPSKASILSKLQEIEEACKVEFEKRKAQLDGANRSLQLARAKFTHLELQRGELEKSRKIIQETLLNKEIANKTDIGRASRDWADGNYFRAILRLSYLPTIIALIVAAVFLPLSIPTALIVAAVTLGVNGFALLIGGLLSFLGNKDLSLGGKWDYKTWLALFFALVVPAALVTVLAYMGPAAIAIAGAGALLASPIGIAMVALFAVASIGLLLYLKMRFIDETNTGKSLTASVALSLGAAAVASLIFLATMGVVPALIAGTSAFLAGIGVAAFRKFNEILAPYKPYAARVLAAGLAASTAIYLALVFGQNAMAMGVVGTTAAFTLWPIAAAVALVCVGLLVYAHKQQVKLDEAAAKDPSKSAMISPVAGSSDSASPYMNARLRSNSGVQPEFSKEEQEKAVSNLTSSTTGFAGENNQQRWITEGFKSSVVEEALSAADASAMKEQTVPTVFSE